MPDQTMRERVTDQTPTTEDVQLAATQCPDGITPAEWDAWLTTYTRAVKAEAWAEGQDAGFGACENGGSYTANPYRIEAEDG